MAKINEHAVSPLNTGSGFVIMQIGCPELDHVYSVVISPALAACGLVARRIDKHNKGGLLKSEIITGIRTADIIVADLTNERPNCYLEVGYAMGINRFQDLILTARQDHNPSSVAHKPSGPRIHFDLAGYDILFWSGEKLPEFRIELEKRVRSRRRRAVVLDADEALVPSLLAFVADYEHLLDRNFDCLLTRGRLAALIAGAAPRVAEKIRSYPNWTSGGDIVMSSDIVQGRCQFVVCFLDPMSSHPHDPRTVLQACHVNGIPLFTNDGSAREWLDALGKSTPT